MFVVHDLSGLALLVGAAFVAGVLNALAGGGSFLTLPALIQAGVPPVMANATGTVALLPGYVGSCWGYRAEMGPAFHGRRPWPLLIAALAGGLLGAGLLVVTPDDVFRGLVPWLLAAATLLFAAGDRIARALTRMGAGGPAQMVAGLFLVSAYGGYFNGGVGILLLALFTVMGIADLNAANALKNLMSVVLTTIALAAYAAAGVVAWQPAAVMAVAAVAGGIAGARLGRRIPRPWLKAVIITIGVAMTIAFFRAG